MISVAQAFGREGGAVKVVARGSYGDGCDRILGRANVSVTK